MKTLLIILLFTIYSMFAFADTTQNNTSGSNTNISGGYTSSATNTYQSGSYCIMCFRTSLKLSFWRKVIGVNA